MDEHTYLELRRKIQAEAEKKLEALDIVWGLLNNDSGGRHEEPNLLDLGVPTVAQSSQISEGSAKNGRVRRTHILQDVREAVQRLEGEFTQQDVTDIIAEKRPYSEIRRGSVSNALSRMTKRGEGIELVEESSGSVPSIYRKTENSPLQDEPPPEETVGDEPFREDIVGKRHEE